MLTWTQRGTDDKAFHKVRLRMSKDRIYSQFFPLYTDREAKGLYTGTTSHRDQSALLALKIDQQNCLNWLKTQDL